MPRRGNKRQKIATKGNTPNVPRVWSTFSVVSGLSVINRTIEISSAPRPFACATNNCSLNVTAILPDPFPSKTSGYSSLTNSKPSFPRVRSKAYSITRP